MTSVDELVSKLPPPERVPPMPPVKPARKESATWADLGRLGYRYPMEWLKAEPTSMNHNLQIFDAGEKREGTKTTKITISKVDQAADLAKVLANPFLQRHYRYIIAEEAGCDNARKLGALLFAAFYKVYWQAKRNNDVGVKPPRWVVVDNDPKQELPLDASAIFLDNYAFTATSLKGDKVRDFLTRWDCPVFLVCSGSDPYRIIAEKLNTSFDVYAFLRTHLARNL